MHRGIVVGRALELLLNLDASHVVLAIRQQLLDRRGALRVKGGRHERRADEEQDRKSAPTHDGS